MVAIAADGTMVHDRASGTEFEVKLGLVFAGAERVGINRQRLTERQLYGGTEGWHAFAERFVAGCARPGVFDAEQIRFVSDGARRCAGCAGRTSRRRSSCSTGSTLPSSCASASVRPTLSGSNKAFALARVGQPAALADLL